MRNSQTSTKGGMSAHSRRSKARLLTASAAIAAALVVMVACNDITHLEQSNPGQLGPGVFSPENADLIVNSSRGDFECAYNQYIVGSGLFVDELANAISRTENFDHDRRTITPDEPYGTSDCTAQQFPGIYTPLSVARASNDTAVAHLQGWTDEQVPDRHALIGVASTYAGFSLTMLGESMCSAAINLGPELQPPQIFAEAMLRFDTAVVEATAAGDDATLHLALLGRARTELDLNNSADAAADAALIPPGFEADIDHDASASRRVNLVYVHTRQAAFSSVDTSIINRDTTDHDPRIAVTNSLTLGSDGFTTIWYANKDASSTSVQALAKYSEAQLIIAENDANTSNLGGAVTIINAVRLAAGDTTTFNPGTLTQPVVMAEIVEQRRREFFLEGHRLGDLRRLGLPMSPAVGAPYVSGGSYGAQSCFPLPNVERVNNPNI
jgi:hypothetical protein